VEVYHNGANEAELTIQDPNIREVSFTLKPGEMRRLRTDWLDHLRWSNSI
jgi:hypothetical protein